MAERTGANEPPDNEADYNPIFEKFVDHANEGQSLLIGFVAYGLYKRAKREWAASIREEHGRGPTEDELKHYVATWTASQIEGKRSEARDVLAAFSDTVERSARPRILREALQGRFWQGVGQSVVGALAYTLILILVVIVLKTTGVGLPNFDLPSENETAIITEK